MEVRQVLSHIGSNSVRTHPFGDDLLSIFSTVLPAGLTLHPDCTGADLMSIYEILPDESKARVKRAVPTPDASDANTERTTRSLLTIAMFMALLSSMLVIALVAFISMSKFDSKERTPAADIIEDVIVIFKQDDGNK